MKILIIENDRWFAESLQNMLPFDTKIAPETETALELTDSFQPDMIITDINLGAKNALALLSELQSYTDTRVIPVIIMSTDSHRLKLDDLRKFGVVALIDKSQITPELLVSKIRQGNSHV
jgi:DNA-binding NarL/FixJ family response regulator